MVSTDFAGVLKQLDEMVEAYSAMFGMFTDANGFGRFTVGERAMGAHVYKMCLADTEKAVELLKRELEN